MIASVIKHLKLTNIYILKKFFCEERLIGKIVLECEGEILNVTEAFLDDKKETCEKSYYLIHTVSLVILCLLFLTVVSFGCYYYFTRDWIFIMLI